MARSQRSVPGVILSIRLNPETRDQLEDLADATGRTKSFIAAEAIESYIALQSWQVKAIETAVSKADSKKAKFIEHEKVADWLSSWGNKNEQEPPK